VKSRLRREAFEAFGSLLHQLARGRYVIGIHPLDENWTPLDFTAENLRGWTGRLVAVVRLRELNARPVDVRRILPLFDDREELLNLLVLALLWAKRDWFEHFVGRIDPTTYRKVASASLVPPCTLDLYAPDGRERSWRIGFVLHCADVAAMLDDAMKDLALEAAERK
jgi:hypothetical protein